MPPAPRPARGPKPLPAHAPSDQGPEEPHAADLRQCTAVLGGDEAAAETLFRRHFDALYDFVHYRAGRDRGPVEDLVQETFLTALDRLQHYDGRASFHLWLCGIARNKLREHRRRRRPRPLSELLLEADDELLGVLARIEAEELPDWALERRETAELVGATLSSLPPDYREALLAKYVAGESVRDIGARNGRGEKATESLLGRARRAFGQVLGVLSERVQDGGPRRGRPREERR